MTITLRTLFWVVVTGFASAAVALVGLGVAHASAIGSIERHAAQLAKIDEDVQRDHDRLVRFEAQIEAVYMLTRDDVNDRRRAAGRAEVPDKFPRDDDER